MFRFELPDIGEGVVEAEVIAWHVAEGDDVALDQVLVELMTDKANVEIPSPAAGRVAKLCYAEGDVVPVGEVLIEIDDGAEAKPSAPEPAAATVEAPQPAARPDPAPAPSTHSAAPPTRPGRPAGSQRATSATSADGVRAVPAVRALAARLGVDLTKLAGSGPDGRIMRRDVEAAKAGREAHPEVATDPPGTSAAPARADGEAGSQRAEVADPEDWERQPLRGLRRAIARHMSEARRRAAHFTYVEELDVTQLMELRREAGSDLSPLAFIARAVVQVLPDHPRLNASIDDEREEIVLKQRIHLGVAVAARDGLVVPVISNAHLLDTRGLAGQIADLGLRAREARLVPAQLRGGTFTISSLGKLGGIVSTPIVNHPEVAILGVNAIRAEPRYVGEEIARRQLMNLSISVDHRIADGHDAALFVQDLARILEGADYPDVFGRAGEGT